MEARNHYLLLKWWSAFTQTACECCRDPPYSFMAFDADNKSTTMHSPTLITRNFISKEAERSVPSRPHPSVGIRVRSPCYASQAHVSLSKNPSTSLNTVPTNGLSMCPRKLRASTDTLCHFLRQKLLPPLWQRRWTSVGINLDIDVPSSATSFLVHWPSRRWHQARQSRALKTHERLPPSRGPACALH